MTYTMLSEDYALCTVDQIQYLVQYSEMYRLVWSLKGGQA